MRRTTLAIALVACLALAGCTGSGIGSGPGGDDPTSDAPATSPAPPDGQTWERMTAAPAEGDHRALPERPDDLTAESVREYVRAYEEAYQYNRAIDGSLGVDASCSVGVDAVTETAHGYRVEVSCFVAAYQEGTGTHTMHGDRWPSATYVVNDSTTLRAGTSY